MDDQKARIRVSTDFANDDLEVCCEVNVMYDNGYGSTSTRKKMSCSSFSVERGQGKKVNLEKTVANDLLSTQASQLQTSGAQPLDQSQRGRAWRPPGDSLRPQGLSDFSVSSSRVQHQSCWAAGQGSEDHEQAGGSPGSHPGAFQLSQEEVRQKRLGALGRVILASVTTSSQVNFLSICRMLSP